MHKAQITLTLTIRTSPTQKRAKVENIAQALMHKTLALLPKERVIWHNVHVRTWADDDRPRKSKRHRL